MYLFLATFWLVLGILVQVFWDSIATFSHFSADRTVMAVIFFVLFSYNFFRWRMQRALRKANEVDAQELPPRPRVVHREYDPTFDFSKPDDEKKDPK
ncbi:MAG: hypothetical protein EXR98_12590 [Gemmataceae bacterium]|nr:hypothetical protein [Gemmataceae bacterium]